ncbi:BsuBI/PstI family type II restriction endonuclease [Polyangium aurulentum]|uniref:BsuBI/PstI family type II restriction endonuclease n=1 Tax=Polyangium aurulentum TaxID=2567896 RepID=UPI0010ADCBE6|nr:BsuBI/PstI family type II restriction endonuclease [Polyangium aurulentum]UQA60208.1 hypothetical protein E8A73_006930 [Polyangium aurulentum]
MTAPLPSLLSRPAIQARLLEIFPEGFPFRNYCTRDTATATVFSMLYVGAVEGTSRWLAPKQVYKMSDEQALLVSDAARLEFARNSLRGGFLPSGLPWYADTSREPIRDETIRQGFLHSGAVIENKEIPTTSSKPRYALAADFARLFDPRLDGVPLTEAIEAWRALHLSAGALARIKLVRAGASKDPAGIIVNFPNAETRRLTAGESSTIAKYVIEQFAPRFLDDPVVIWLSESKTKVVARDDLLAKQINLTIDPSRNLPDIILAGLGAAGGILLVFVEVVATDGPVSEARREELRRIAAETGLDEEHIAFVTAYMDRSSPALRKNFATLAWNTFIWIASEPESIVALYGDTAPRLHALIRARARS